MGMKLVTKKPKVNGLWLSRVEKNVLFQKYLSQGLSWKDAREKVSGCSEFLSTLVDKLRKKEVSDEEIGIKFKEEFAKMRDRF